MLICPRCDAVKLQAVYTKVGGKMRSLGSFRYCPKCERVLKFVPIPTVEEEGGKHEKGAEKG